MPRPVARHWVALATIVASVMTVRPGPTDGAASPPQPVGTASLQHPGRSEALDLATRGTTALQESHTALGTTLLLEAIAADPQLAGAWVNLAAGYIDACLADDARAAAMVARHLAPGDEDGARNLRLALEISCQEPRVAVPRLLEAERRAIVAQTDAAAFVEAASARRAQGQRLLAAFWDERALALGAARASTIARIAEDYESLALLDAAAMTFEAVGDEPSRERARHVRARSSTLWPEARRLGARIAREAGWSDANETLLASALAHVLLARGSDAEAALTRLRQDLELDRPRVHRGAFGSVEVGLEWAALDVPAAEGRAPDLVLRRFPGDTQLALYVWPALDDQAADATLVRLLAPLGATSSASWSPCDGAPATLRCRALALEIDAGAEGRAPLSASLLGPAGGAETVLALALPGSSGCGDPCRLRAADALARAIALIEPAPEPSRAKAPSALALPLPGAWRAARTYDESRDAWRTHSLGDTLRVDAPPGIVAARVEPGFAPEGARPEMRLWMRGGFIDQDGITVRIGDERVFGTIDVHEGEGEAALRLAGTPYGAPHGDAQATFRAKADLGDTLGRAATGDAGVVARWNGAAFPGDWFVYHLRVGADLVVITLPVSQGAKSLSLHWIALTVRRESQAPVPPPVDLSSQHRIVFRRIETPTAADPREGILDAGDLRLASPRGYRVSMSSYSNDGFPVSLRSTTGGVIVIERLTPGEGATLPARSRQIEALTGTGAGPWERARKSRDAAIVTRALAPDDGRDRRAWLVVPERHADLPAYRIIATRGESQERALFEDVIAIVEASLRYDAPD